MATTFLKRQKEMKRMEKRREKADRRAQKKPASRTQNEPPAENISSADNEASRANIAAPSESEPHN
jgi:hypothetical protein